MDVGELRDGGALWWYLSWSERQLSWKTVTPKDEVGESAIEAKDERRKEKAETLTVEVLGNLPDSLDEIDDPLRSV